MAKNGLFDLKARMRIPLPAKLFLSYLFLLAVAALPTFIYVRASLDRDLVGDALQGLTGAARRGAAALAELPAPARPTRARDLALMTGDRVTLIAASGQVLYDSEVRDLASHADRPEVIAALAGGVGTAQRLSDSTHVELLYAAARLGAPGDELAVLRVARPLSRVRNATEALTGFARNVQAAAVSIAILLSLVAAAQFVRPLRRVVAAAQALGAGDLAARSGVDGNDEVGDVGRVIDGLATEMRRRLANAGSGDAVLAQLVDAVPVPCVVFEVSGEVLALNGAARTALRLEGPNASRRLKEVASSPDFERALAVAEGDGEPEPLSVPLAGGGFMRAHVHVLKRPGTAPLYVLVGIDAPAAVATTLPPVDAVVPRPFIEVMSAARGEAGAALTRAGVGLEVSDTPGVMVADAADRVPRALALALDGCAQALAGRASTLCIDVKVDGTSVRLALDGELATDTVARIRPLLEPIGGGVSVQGGEATLWLPRA
ncbi:MAG: HAMP domain-containing protein [Deltaproteobacteria bacterium]|nr:HAMP domain-containing protein [Deltaproteobacteria bacterium]